MAKRELDEQDIYEHLFSDAAEEKARGLGLKVVYPENNELQVDIDSKQDRKLFEERMKRLSMVFMTVGHASPPTYCINPSKSGEKWRCHATVRFRPADKVFGVVERLFLQLYLGSDPKREILSYMAHEMGEPRPTIFFEKGDHPDDDPTCMLTEWE